MSSSKARKHSTYHHGDLRQALVEAARALLREGTDKLSLRGVARKAGVSHAAAYYHFEDKTGLLAAVAIEAFEDLHTAVGKAREHETLSSQEQLHAEAFAYVEFALANPHEFRLMFLPELRSDAVRTDVEKAGRARHERTINTIRALQEEGYLKAGDPGVMAITLWATLHGLATLMIDGPLYRNAKTQEGREALISASVDHLLNGIGASAS